MVELNGVIDDANILLNINGKQNSPPYFLYYFFQFSKIEVSENTILNSYFKAMCRLCQVYDVQKYTKNVYLFLKSKIKHIL